MTEPFDTEDTPDSNLETAPEDPEQAHRSVFANMLILLSVLSLALAAAIVVLTFMADDDPDVAPAPTPSATAPSEEPTDEPTEEPSQEPSEEPTDEPSAEPPPTAINRGDITVDVFNNSSVSGLAARTAEEVDAAGWPVGTVENWVGSIPSTTVYYPPGLKRAAKLLAKDVGVDRLMPAVSPMRTDGLTLILTGS